MVLERYQTFFISIRKRSIVFVDARSSCSAQLMLPQHTWLIKDVVIGSGVQVLALVVAIVLLIRSVTERVFNVRLALLRQFPRLRRDENDTVRAACSIHRCCCRSFENFDIVNIVGIEV